MQPEVSKPSQVPLQARVPPPVKPWLAQVCAAQVGAVADLAVPAAMLSPHTGPVPHSKSTTAKPRFSSWLSLVKLGK